MAWPCQLPPCTNEVTLSYLITVGNNTTSQRMNKGVCVERTCSGFDVHGSTHEAGEKRFIPLYVLAAAEKTCAARSARHRRETRRFAPLGTRRCAPSRLETCFARITKKRIKGKLLRIKRARISRRAHMIVMRMSHTMLWFFPRSPTSSLVSDQALIGCCQQWVSRLGGSG